MATAAEIGEWLSGLGDDVVEIRCRAGVTSKTLESVGVVEADGEVILAAVDDAGYGDVVRLYAYDAKGKQLRTKLFRSDGDDRRGSAGGMSQAEATADVLSRVCSCLERVVDSISEPVESMAQLMSRAVERADEAETAAMELALENAKQEAMLERAADELERPTGSSEADLSIKREALEMVKKFLGQGGSLHDFVQGAAAENGD